MRTFGSSYNRSGRTSRSYKQSERGNIIAWLLVVIVIVFCILLFVPNVTSTAELKEKAIKAVRAAEEKALNKENDDEDSGSKANSDSDMAILGTTTVAATPTVTHVLPPKSVKAVYMSSWVGGTQSLRTKIVDLIERTELNAVVLDIKDYTGMISFKPNSVHLQTVGCIEERIRDIDSFIKELHEKNIYVIGRVAVFQDPCLVKKQPELAVKRKSDGGIWKDRNGITWMDAGSQDVWDYNIEIAKASHEMGFDEINFDYIRYPTDGNMQDISFPVSGTRPKPTTLEGFFKYIDKQLRGGRASTSTDPVFDEMVLQYGLNISTSSASRADAGLDGQKVETTIDSMPRPIISADLFGLVTNSTDDLGIGQVLLKAAPYLDFIGPMVYPSHYPPTYIGYKNPAAYPYEIVHHAMAGGVDQLQGVGLSPLKLRPWLQDFNLGATYTADMVRKQIKATYDVGLTSWMLWDASNTYTAGGALGI